MICSTSYVTVLCDSCGAGLSSGDVAAGGVARFGSRSVARSALLRAAGWMVADGDRLACPDCAVSALCARVGHDFSPGPGRSEDGSLGWRLCACGASLPGHRAVGWSASAVPAGPWALECAMAYRLCGRCPVIEECPVTELDLSVVDPHPGPASPTGAVSVAGSVA